MRKKFFTLDVFTTKRFSGNPLAVLPDAAGLSTAQMQSIAREFNYSESTFVLPSETDGDYRVRIFTPEQELPFAGHPTIGTAILLATQQQSTGNDTIVLEEKAGIVPVTISEDVGSNMTAEFRAPGSIEQGDPVQLGLLADAVGLQQGDFIDHPALPCFAQCGIGFLFAEIASLDALGRAVPPQNPHQSLIDAGLANGVYLFTRETGDPAVDVRSRMFAPLHGIPEDPATGSAAAAFGGLMALLGGRQSGETVWRIEQGVEMGRASQLTARSVCRDGEIDSIFVAGSAVQVTEGMIDVD